MSIYVPRPLTALYTLLWRLVISWFTIIFGSLVFWVWVRRGLKAVEQEPAAEGTGIRAQGSATAPGP